MIDNLDTHTAGFYLEGINRIESQEALLAIRITSYPNMKKEEQSKTHKDLHKIAYPKEQKKMSLDDLERSLRG